MTQDLPPGLVTAWIQAMRPAGESLATLADELREATGTYCDASRLCAWRRGSRTVPQRVQRVMRRDVLCYLLGDELGDAMAERLETTSAAGSA